MKTIRHTVACCAVLAITTAAFAQNFEFKAGYPEPDTSIALSDEMDYQRAVHAYIWATPLLNSMGFRAGLGRYGVNETNGKFLVFEQSLNPNQIAIGKCRYLIRTTLTDTVDRISPRFISPSKTNYWSEANGIYKTSHG